MAMLMTPADDIETSVAGLDWQLFASQQTDLLLLPPLTGTWLGFMSGKITGA